MMLDHGDPAHVAVETEFVALVAEVLRGAKADTPAMMQGTAEAYDPLSHDSAPAFRRALNGPSREETTNRPHAAAEPRHRGLGRGCLGTGRSDQFIPYSSTKA